MARKKRKVKSLPTIWEVSDELWAIIEPVMNQFDPPRLTPGRPRIDRRATLNGIICQMRSGCQWNHLPRQFGDAPSVHRTFQRWVNKGVLQAIWIKLVENSAIVVEQPEPTEDSPQHLCLDKGYDNPTGYATVAEEHYRPHIHRIGEERPDERKRKRHSARR